MAAVASDRILFADAKILPINALPKSGKLDKIDGKHNAPLAMAVNWSARAFAELRNPFTDEINRMIYIFMQ